MWRYFYALHFVACFEAAFWSNASSASDLIVGAWEGESICRFADSPFHDEHVILRASRNNGAAGKARLATRS
jgi:hypothetical protein